MRRIFWGCLLILLNLTVMADRYRVGLIGGCIGCVLLLGGLHHLTEKSTELKYARNLTVILIVEMILTMVIWLLKPGGEVVLGRIAVADVVIAALLQILIMKMIAMGMQDIEAQCQTDLGGDGLRRAWMWMAVFQVMAVLSLVVPVFPALTEILAIAMSLIFLLQLNRVMHRYMKWEECR